MPDLETDLEVDRLLAEQSPALLKWMLDEQLTFDDCRKTPWGGIQSKLRGRGMLEAGIDWMKKTGADLRDYYSLCPDVRVGKALSRRFVIARMEREEPVPQVREETKELDILPDHLRWVVLHPGLSTEGSEMAMDVAVRGYEEKNPAPNQAAVNLYHHCKSDKTTRQKLFDEVGRVLLEERKRKAAAKEAAKGEADPEAEALEEMERQFEEKFAKMKAN